MINLKSETAKKLSALGINESTTFALFDSGLVDERTAKKFLVREAFNEAKPQKGKICEVRQEIADKFCVSFETVGLYLKL